MWQAAGRCSGAGRRGTSAASRRRCPVVDARGIRARSRCPVPTAAACEVSAPAVPSAGRVGVRRNGRSLKATVLAGAMLVHLAWPGGRDVRETAGARTGWRQQHRAGPHRVTAHGRVEPVMPPHTVRELVIGHGVLQSVALAAMPDDVEPPTCHSQSPCASSIAVTSSNVI